MNYEAIQGINQSTLKHFHKCKSLAHAHYNSHKKYDNETLSFGRLVHSLILERELFDSQYIVADKPDCRTTVGKNLWSALLADASNSGRALVSQADFATADRMRRAVESHPAARELLYTVHPAPARRQTEQLLVGVLADVDGAQHDAKGRADCILTEYYTQPVIVDLKTTDDASSRGFMDSCAKYAYHLQAAFYVDLLVSHGLPDAKFVFVAVEKTAPYGVQVFEADEEFIARGRSAYKNALKLWAECQKKLLMLEEIPAYSDTIETAQLPTWA